MMGTANRKQPEIVHGEEHPRVWRLEPLPEQEVFVDEGHSWAVSYSDLLMVLMSFFILFFSYQDDQPTDLLQNIAMSLMGNRGGTNGVGDHSGTVAPGNLGAVGGQQGAAAGNQTGTPISANKAMQETLQDVLKTSTTSVTWESEPKAVTIAFNEHVFAKRDYQISKDLAKTMDQILDRLAEHKGHLKIYFVGHTDSSKVSHRKDGITDNFVLSSLRASSALAYAVEKGFIPSQLYTQGAADNLAKFRTISIRIEWVGAPQGT